MESDAQERLGATAVRYNPRVLAAVQAGGRVRVALRAKPPERELLSAFGPSLLILDAGDGVVLEIDAPDSARPLNAASPLVRAVTAAVFARRAAPARPRILGVLNVTPDSFSDGGAWNDPGRAIERGLELVAEGAHMLDIGGESTRPGSSPVALEEERRRVLPVIQGLAGRARVPLCVDTTKARLAEEALDAGAQVINDVSAGRFDPEMIRLVSRRDCLFSLMHMQGSPLDMQRRPSYRDVVDDVLQFLRERAGVCFQAGIAPERLWIDPGIGFGKALEHNLQLLLRLGELRSLGLRILVGPSRKSFIEQVRRREESGAPQEADALRPPHERIGGTAAAIAMCVYGGAEFLRVHDVRVMAEAARVAHAIATA